MNLTTISAIVIAVLLALLAAAGYFLKQQIAANGTLSQQVHTATEANKAITNATTTRAKIERTNSDADYGALVDKLQ